MYQWYLVRQPLRSRGPVMARIARLFAPLDVEFATDPKIIKAGPLAGYLFVCGLAYVKRSGTEGVIHPAQVQYIAPGLADTSKLARKLLDVGLWTRTADGNYYVTAWARHNLSGDQLAERKEMQRTKAIAANHKRHHVDKKVNEPDCELCNPGPNGDKESSQQGAGMVPREREGRGRGTEKGEEEEASSSSPDGSSNEPTSTADDDGLIDQIINRCALRRAQEHRADDVEAYAATTVKNMQRTERSVIAQMLMEKPWYRTQLEKAAAAHETNRRFITERSA